MSGDNYEIIAKADSLENSVELTPTSTENLAISISIADENKLGGEAKCAEEEPTIWERLGFTKHGAGPIEDCNVPQLSYLDLFKEFLWFGCRAFGGPVAQIAMMKQELVTEKKWISNERFMRAYAVYQVLPGPEATELACYFGLLSRGRLGAIVGGVGFLLPGWMAMLLLSYIYVEYGLESDVIQHSFQAVQIAVSALIFRATYKLADGAFKNHKKEFSWRKGFLCFFCFVASVIKLNFFIALGVSGVINTLFESQKIPLRDLIGIGIAIATIGFFALYCALNGVPDGSLIGGDSGEEDGTTYTGLLELGLIAGMVTFGGAYTTLPFVYAIAVESGGWLTQQEFLDAIAITNMMPTPLVTFVTMVGYIGNGIGGAILITVGIFLPAFSFTIIGHEIFEALVDNKYVEPFLDGVGAAVIGLLLITAFDFLSHVVSTGIDAVVFFLAFWAAFHFTDKYTQPIILVVAGVAGQALY